MHGSLALEASGDGFWEWDLLAGSAWYSEWFSRELSWEPSTRHEPLRAWQPHILAPDWLVLLREIRGHLEQKRCLDVYVRVYAGDGSLRWWRIRGAATRDAAGRPALIGGSVLDVTNHRRSMEVAEFNQRMLRTAFDELPLAVAVLAQDGEILDVNRGWQEFPGADAPLGPRFGFGENYLDACRTSSARNPVFASLYSGLTGLTTGEPSRHTAEYECMVDGDAHRMRCVAVACRHELTRWIVVTHVDLTQLGAGHGSRFDYKTFYEMILDAVPVHIAYINRDRRLRYLNRSYERWLQVPLAAIDNAAIEDLADEAHRKETSERVDRVLRGAHVDFEVERGFGDGREHALKVSYLPRVDALGQVQGFFSVARDVSAERRLEKELRQASKLEAIGHMSGGLAHDLNNLLGVIIGNLQLLQRRTGADAAARQAVDTALRAATSGSDLAKNLLAFARQQPLKPTSLSVDAVISRVRDILTQAVGPGVQFEFELGAGQGNARIDAAQLENAVLNLVKNAGDAMSGRGRIRIATRAAAASEQGYPPEAPVQSWLVEVADDGPGMTPEVERHAFEPFFTTKPEGKGTGLGLATVYGFARQSGGTATIETQVGTGTKVRLWFPRDEDYLT